MRGMLLNVMHGQVQKIQQKKKTSNKGFPKYSTLINYGKTRKAVVSTQRAWCNERLKVTTIKSSQNVYKRICNRKPISIVSVYSL